MAASPPNERLDLWVRVQDYRALPMSILVAQFGPIEDITEGISRREDFFPPTLAQLSRSRLPPAPPAGPAGSGHGPPFQQNSCPSSMEERILGALGCPCSWESLMQDLGLEANKDGVLVFAHLRALIECGSVLRRQIVPAGGHDKASGPAARGTHTTTMVSGLGAYASDVTPLGYIRRDFRAPADNSVPPASYMRDRLLAEISLRPRTFLEIIKDLHIEQEMGKGVICQLLILEAEGKLKRAQGPSCPETVATWTATLPHGRPPSSRRGQPPSSSRAAAEPPSSRPPGGVAGGPPRNGANKINGAAAEQQNGSRQGKIFLSFKGQRLDYWRTPFYYGIGHSDLLTYHVTELGTNVPDGPAHSTQPPPLVDGGEAWRNWRPQAC